MDANVTVNNYFTCVVITFVKEIILTIVILNFPYLRKIPTRTSTEMHPVYLLEAT